MTTDEIRAAVTQRVAGTKRRQWRVGITQNLDDRRAHWRNPATFTHWLADSLDVAREVEWLLLDKGMQGNEGGVMAEAATTYVYIFQA